MARAAAAGGLPALQLADEAVTVAFTSAGGAAGGTAAIDAGAAAAEAVADAAESGGVAAAEAVADTIQAVAGAGGSAAEIVAAARTVADEAGTIVGQGGTASDAADVARSMATLARSAADAGVTPQTVLANAAAVAQTGGPTAAIAYAQVIDFAAAVPGITGKQVVQIAWATTVASSNLGTAGIQAVFKGIQAAARGGGADMIDIAYTIIEGAQISLEGGATPQQAISVANHIAGVAEEVSREQAAAISRGFPAELENPADVIEAAKKELPLPPVPPPPFTDAPPSAVDASNQPFPSFDAKPLPPAHDKLSGDLKSGADKGTIETDARQLATSDNSISLPPNAPVVSTPDGRPLRIGESEGPTDLKQKLLSADYNKLSDDLKSGADKATIAKDAQQVAILASGFGATGLEQVALIIGSGGTVSSDRDNADALSVVSPDADAAYVSLGSRGTPTSDAYLQLELDIAGNADPQKIKQDADNLAQLANGSGDTALASVATGISNSISDHSYDQSGSLTALMNNSPASGSGSPTPPSQTPPPIDVAAYDKLQADIQSGADEPTLIADAAQLAIAAAGAGDTGLEAVAHNIGNSVGNGTYSKDGSLSALSNAAPGTAGARTAQPPLSSDAAGGAYLKLENDIEHGVDQKTVQADAEQVKALAQQDGNTHLADAANAILTGIGNGSYDQVGAEEALMNDGTTNTSQNGPSDSADETSAYQKLISDIRSGADNTTLMNDVFSLSEASIQNSDFGTGQAALDIGNSIKGGTFDPNAALQALAGVTPGTSAAQLPPITALTV